MLIHSINNCIITKKNKYLNQTAGFFIHSKNVPDWV